MLYICFLILFFQFASSEPFIGVNIGVLDDNQPPPHVTVQALESTCIEKVRLLEVESNLMKALANTQISVIIGVDNTDIPSLAGDINFAKDWIKEFVTPYHPATNLTVIAVGEEVVTRQEHHHLAPQILPALENMQKAVNSAGLGGQIKVSSVQSMSVLTGVRHPSTAVFKADYEKTIKEILKFLKTNKSPFMINLYPFVEYEKDPTIDMEDFCLFKSTTGITDTDTGHKYMNMYDSLVDSTRAALAKSGNKDMEIIVSETGWPYKGGASEQGTSLPHAQAYMSGLVNHLKKNKGTPMVPGKSVDTYLFELFDENLKGGAPSDRSYGLFKPDLTVMYNSGVLITPIA